MNVNEVYEVTCIFIVYFTIKKVLHKTVALLMLHYTIQIKSTRRHVFMISFSFHVEEMILFFPYHRWWQYRVGVASILY